MIIGIVPNPLRAVTTEITGRRLARAIQRAEVLCARLNGGLAAVALALARMMAALYAARHADARAPVPDPGTGIAVFAADF